MVAINNRTGKRCGCVFDMHDSGRNKHKAPFILLLPSHIAYYVRDYYLEDVHSNPQQTPDYYVYKITVEKLSG